jgi:hypothetical protein
VTVSNQALLEQLETDRAAANDAHAAFRGIQERVQAARLRVQAEAARQQVVLAAAYLDQLDQASIDEAEALTGFRGFKKGRPLEAMAREQQALRRRIAEIEADTRFVRREYLVGPHGERTRALEEAQSLLDPWELECQRFEQHEGFTELVSLGYDTPAFAVPWWKPTYWRHWADGDRICAALEMSDFGDDVLPAWRKVDEERRRWRTEVALAETKVNEVHELVAERDQAQARLQRLPETTLQHCQELLGAFLADADAALLERWANEKSRDDTAARPRVLGLRRVAGLRAKLDILDEIDRQGVQAVLDSLGARINKTGRKITKFQRPKYSTVSHADQTLDRSFPQKADKLQSQAASTELLLDRMLAYQDYERFPLDQPPELWWEEFTGKRPTSLLPELRTWYQRNPTASRRREADDSVAQAAVAAAVLSHDHDEVSFLS